MLDALAALRPTFRRLLLTLLAAPSVLLAEEMTAAEVFETVSDSIVVILGVDVNGRALVQGSGVVFELAHIATNCHVYREAFRAVVQYRGEEVPAALLHMDADRDVCSFVAPLLTAPPAQIGSTEELRVGQTVYAIGAPRGMELTLSDGLISGLRPTSGGQLLQTTAPISPGCCFAPKTDPGFASKSDPPQ